MAIGRRNDCLLLNRTVIASGATTVDFTSIMSDTYSRYEVVLDDVYSSESGGSLIRVQGSTDNGSTWLTSGAYASVRIYMINGGSLTGDSSTSSVGVTTGISLGDASGEGISGTFELMGNATGKTVVNYQIGGINGATNFATASGSGAFISGGVPNAWNAFRFILGGGTFEGGTIRVYGYK